MIMNQLKPEYDNRSEDVKPTRKPAKDRGGYKSYPTGKRVVRMPGMPDDGGDEQPMTSSTKCTLGIIPCKYHTPKIDKHYATSYN